jgi:serine/threonine protein kinase
MVTEEGSAKIIDLGLANLVEPLGADSSEAETAVAGQTEPGVVMGTFAYMSPEQVRCAGPQPGKRTKARFRRRPSRMTRK